MFINLGWTTPRTNLSHIRPPPKNHTNVGNRTNNGWTQPPPHKTTPPNQNWLNKTNSSNVGWQPQPQNNRTWIKPLQNTPRPNFQQVTTPQPFLTQKFVPGQNNNGKYFS